MNLIDMSDRVFTQVVQASFAAVILGIIVLVLERLLRRRLSPAWLFALYLPVLVRLLLPVFPEAPTSLFNFPKWVRYDRFDETQTLGQVQSQEITSISALEISATPLPVQTIPSPDVNTFASAPAFTLVQILSLVWLGVTIALLLRIVGGAWRLKRMLAKQSVAATELDPSLAGLGGLGGEVRPHWMPKVIETPLVESPCLFGLFRPRILLPVGLSRRLTSAELSHVLLHELAHMKRADLILNAFMTVAQAIHWFNPFVWLLFRRMRLQRELACDRWVLETRCADAGEARAYGETLLKLIQEHTPRHFSPSLVGILEDEQSAKARLRQIAAFKPGGSRNRTAGVFVLLMLAVVGLSNAQTEKTVTALVEVPQPSQPVNRIEQTNKTSAGIQMLVQEYERQKKEVDAARERVDRLRLEYNISSVEESGSNTERDDQLSLQQRLKAVAEEHSYDNAMLNHLKTLNRRDLRKALPTALRPPDELLNRYLADLGSAEQKVIALSENFSDEHYEVKNVRNVMQKINEQIENRIDGILAGLEARKVVAENLAHSLKTEMRETQVGYAEKQKKFAPFFRAKRDLENAQRILDTIFMRLLAEKVDAQIPRSDAPQRR